jgi:hypothetical protein
MKKIDKRLKCKNIKIHLMKTKLRVAAVVSGLVAVTALLGI